MPSRKLSGGKREYSRYVVLLTVRTKFSLRDVLSVFSEEASMAADEQERWVD